MTDDFIIGAISFANAFLQVCEREIVSGCSIPGIWRMKEQFIALIIKFRYWHWPHLSFQTDVAIQIEWYKK